MPTTTGTGSEVGRSVVLTNRKTHVKKFVLHINIMASVVITDPELKFGMPEPITAETGLNAFAHCVEAFSSSHCHTMSQGIALESKKLLITYLPRANEIPWEYGRTGAADERGDDSRKLL